MKNISGTITSGGSAQVLSAANENRRYLFVQNLSDTALWINDLGDAAGASPSMTIPVGACFELQGPQCAGAWSIYGATTGKAFAAREF